MYICLECGYTFDTPSEATIPHHGLSGRTLETVLECPACRGEDYEHACTCNKCGIYIGESQAEFGLCPDCEIKTEKRFNEMLSAFTPDELAYLNNQYDGRWLGA